MNNKLFVGGISYSATDAELQEFFSQWGTVLSAKIIMDRDTGRSRGFGFVEFENEADAQKVLNLSEEELMFQKRGLKVSLARPQENRAPRPPRNDM